MLKQGVEFTELTPRKRAVLAAVIKTYIETGEPVGSKVLTELIENAPSSATLRNEMSDLCSLGFLAQPHTSAGRVPTSLGYNLYISSLMEPESLGDKVKDFINLQLGAVGCEPQSIPKLAADTLSELTGLPAVYGFCVGKDVYLKHTELLPVTRKSGILLLVTSDGRTLSRMVRFPDGIDNSLKQRFCDIVSDRLKYKPIGELNKVNLQNLMTTIGLDSFALMPIFTELFGMAQEAGSSKAQISGISNLYNLFGDAAANKLLTFNSNEGLLPFLTEDGDETKVLFGNELNISELADKVLVLKSYSWNDKFCGKIGVIGNSRMSYEQIIPSIEYVASRLSKLMNDAKFDMED
ncbi:MAG: heat-inducible transcription repressor HrcA [Clostridia bacterium]|nr:heat-inducible transcription repressor HrcA [Clostridia bacterium]